MQSCSTTKYSISHVTLERVSRVSLSALCACVVASCGGQDESSQVQAALSVGPVASQTPCLSGVDADNDGVTDYFDLVHSQIFEARSPDACFSAGGTVLEVQRRGRGLRSARSQPVKRAAPRTTNYRAGGDLPADVDDFVAAANIHNTRRFEQPHSDCDDFANDLEAAFENEGYTGTYTEICKIGDAVRTWHAVTDIHLDGETYWVEPQTGKQIKLDVNGDGTVTTGDAGNPCDTATEGGWGIRVWDNLGERIAELGSPD